MTRSPISAATIVDGRADRAVAADAHAWADDRVGADQRARADLGAAPDHRARVDDDASLEPRRRDERCAAGETPVWSNDDPGFAADG